jgi:ribosomal protein L11 methylase PrmA
MARSHTASRQPPARISTALIKQRIRSLLPLWLLKFRHDYLIKNSQKQYENLSTKEVFTKIYQEGAWGRSHDSGQRYFSGSGSHDNAITNEYVTAVKKFLQASAEKPSVIDLGCGDFTVGSQIRPLCGDYVACDIVEPLIDWNRQKYKDMNVDFRVLDISEDPLPAADVVFIRQVLQHLSNSHIARVIPQLVAKYKYLVLTEHLPSSGRFTHNLDKPAGAGVRTGLNSGVVLTSPPFDLKPKRDTVLCEVPEGSGIVRTNLYRLV